jgi:hypothetical protein
VVPLPSREVVTGDADLRCRRLDADDANGVERTQTIRVKIEQQKK